MSENANRPGPGPGPFRRIAPWLLAIIVGIGVGWLVGGLFAPSPDETEIAQTETRPAPPPVAPQDEAAQPPASDAAGPPITLAISNRDCNWGADYDGYYRQAADLKNQIERRDGREVDRIVVRVPNRSWRGLTVGGVAAVHGGGAIIFTQPMAQVRAALVNAGVTVSADGVMPLTGELADAIGQQLGETPDGSARYGATMLSCGS